MKKPFFSVLVKIFNSFLFKPFTTSIFTTVLTLPSLITQEAPIILMAQIESVKGDFAVQTEAKEELKNNQNTKPDSNLENFSPTNLINQDRLNSLPLSPGDKLRINIPGIGGEEFSGDYQVNLYGNLEIPFLEPLSVMGLDAQQVKQKLSKILLENQFFRPELFRISVQVLEFAPIKITVSGEVFEPGPVLMNETAANSDGQRGIVSIPGDNPLDRYLTIALRNAGGIKPTADLTQIEIIRGDRLLRKIDLSGIFQGDPIEDLPLIANDRVIVPRSPQGFQKSLVRRSIITPRLVPLYVSNISQPVLGRSQENLTRASTVNFAYGTRLSQVLIFSDCIGGNFIEDERRALLVRVDSQTEEVKALQYSVEEVVRRSPLQEELDPLMMPYDGVACYDSALANSENFFTLLNNFLRPFETISNIFRALDNFFFDNNNNR